MQATVPFAQSLAHGIHVIDTGFHRPMFDASYLIVENGRGAFVDAGTNYSVPRLLSALDAVGLAPDAVDFVIATHVHLDHAGGVGLLMQHLPKASLVVHPLGAPHLIDPTRLLNGARAVYGTRKSRGPTARCSACRPSGSSGPRTALCSTWQDGR